MYNIDNIMLYDEATYNNYKLKLNNNILEYMSNIMCSGL